jgi:methyl-accepting chemotaxis protein
LTRLARTYVVTGDAAYEKHFHDALAIRNGQKPRPENYQGIYWDLVVATGEKPTPDGEPVSLRDMMQKMGFTAEEFAKLDEAQARSDRLVGLEEKAMNAVKGKFDDGTGQYTIEKAPDLPLARQIMHGKEYHKAKFEIMRPIGEVLTLVDTRTQSEVERLREKGRAVFAHRRCIHRGGRQGARA